VVIGVWSNAADCGLHNDVDQCKSWNMSTLPDGGHRRLLDLRRMQRIKELNERLLSRLHEAKASPGVFDFQRLEG
jgi:hypothetical protein